VLIRFLPTTIDPIRVRNHPGRWASRRRRPVRIGPRSGTPGILGRLLEALDHDADYKWSDYNWGRALAGQERYAAAIEQYKKAIEKDPAYDTAYQGWCESLVKLDDPASELAGTGRQQAEDRQRRQALAAARLADQAETFAPAPVQANTAQHRHATVGAGKTHREGVENQLAGGFTRHLGPAASKRERGGYVIR